MALNLKNVEVERLAAEVAQMCGESKTEAIRRALAERKSRLNLMSSPRLTTAGLIAFLERSVWTKVVPEALGRPISKQEEDEILGYGPDGV